jgi:hypothetical protein
VKIYYVQKMLMNRGLIENYALPVGTVLHTATGEDYLVGDISPGGGLCDCCSVDEDFVAMTLPMRDREELTNG